MGYQFFAEVEKFAMMREVNDLPDGGSATSR